MFSTLICTSSWSGCLTHCHFRLSSWSLLCMHLKESLFSVPVVSSSLRYSLPTVACPNGSRFFSVVLPHTLVPYVCFRRLMRQAVCQSRNLQCTIRSRNSIAIHPALRIQLVGSWKCESMNSCFWALCTPTSQLCGKSTTVCFWLPAVLCYQRREVKLCRRERRVSRPSIF